IRFFIKIGFLETLKNQLNSERSYTLNIYQYESYHHIISTAFCYEASMIMTTAVLFMRMIKKTLR
ncbi:MAG: hypothetical protein DRQ49_06215, partial [Gammaproteobacteria bacterium]